MNYQIRSKIIINMHLMGRSKTYIANKFSVTKQLICKIINGDKKYSYHNKRECSFCGDRKYLQIHHIDCNRANNNENNLKILCKECHIAIHKSIKRYRKCDICHQKQTKMYRYKNKKNNFCEDCYKRYCLKRGKGSY